MKISRTTVIQLCIIAGIVAAYFFVDFNAILQKIQGEGEYVTQDQNCDLRTSACSITLKNGHEYKLEIAPKGIPLMQKLHFKIYTNYTKKDTINLRLYATNMNMGQFDILLQKQKDNSYTAFGTLPSCPIGNMNWNADITEASITHKIGARFQFKTEK
jgi:hypothetical protein